MNLMVSITMHCNDDHFDDPGEEEAVQARPAIRYVLGGMRGKRGGV